MSSDMIALSYLMDKKKPFLPVSDSRGVEKKTLVKKHIAAAGKCIPHTLR